MSKRNYAFTEEKIDRYLKEGRGTGEGPEYLPWLTINDFASKGLTCRDKGWKSGRSPHQFFSEGELIYFYFLEWADPVIDIREQYPLDRDKTRFIAKCLGIKYPKYPDTGVDMVLTTDFFIKIVKDGKVQFLARTFKPSEKLQDTRVLEKFMIEYAYWYEQHVSWGIVTEKELPEIVFNTLNWLHPCFYFDSWLPGMTQEMMDAIMHCIKYEIYKESHMSLATLGLEIDHNFNLDSTTGLRILRHLLASKQLRFNILDGINAASPLIFFHDKETEESPLEKAGL